LVPLRLRVKAGLELTNLPAVEERLKEGSISMLRGSVWFFRGLIKLDDDEADELEEDEELDLLSSVVEG